MYLRTVAEEAYEREQGHLGSSSVWSAVRNSFVKKSEKYILRSRPYIRQRSADHGRPR